MSTTPVNNSPRPTGVLSTMRSPSTRTLALALASAAAVAALGGAPSARASAPLSDEPVTLSLVAFSVPKAGNDAAQAAFAETAAGANVTWETSYGASGDQSRSVAGGLHADFVHFSLEPDMTRLVDAGIVAPDWNTGPNHGIVTVWVVVLVVREGNPKGITGWADLARDDISVVTPNPGSSGSARWNILAAYGSVIAAGGSEQEATDYLAKVIGNVETFPGSGRDATTAFLGGVGDVLISYENEAILARQHGESFDYIVPDTTLLIENPGAVTIAADPRAQAYLDFVLSPEGQAAFAGVGFRPIDGTAVTEVDGANDPADPFPQPATLLTIDDDFGGWAAANEQFFQEDTGVVTKLLQEAGA